MSSEIISEFYNPRKCLLVTVGSNEPRKRLDLIDTIISCLPAEISNEINVVNIGSDLRVTDDQLVATFQYADALLFPSVSEGFGYPPAEAMAAGCRVIASDSAAHNEIIPKTNLLPADELRAWVDAIERVHTDWKRNLGETRKPNLNLIEHVREILSPEAHGIALSNAYDLLFEE
jgi:glycosyltransferase involved in cell wall biosynthesis